jgi:hypothetical protein
MRKKAIFATPNRMQFDSLHKTFNKQIDSISTGNVWGDAQFSSYIRSFDTFECNGFNFEAGHLQEFDLKPFRSLIPYWIVDEIKRLTMVEGGILYVFKHFNNGERVIDGVVFTTTDYKEIKRWYFGNYKQQSVLEEAIKYITI